MNKILLSTISLIMTVSFLVGAPVAEKETDTHSLQKEKSARKNKDHSLVKSEAEILVEIEAKILEVNKDAFLDAYKDREGSPNVISDSQASILLNALTREEATDLLCAPRITVKNGEKAEIKVVQEFVIPTGKPSEQTTGGGVGRQVQEIGFELAVTPTVQKNNQIHLQLNPKVTQFDGFVESGGPSDPTGGIGFSKRLPPGILMPTFSTRNIATQVTLTDGATAIIDALTRVEIKKVNEKIPVLGNLPLVCGLLSTESNQTRSLIMFVSAKIASAESSPDRENIQNNTSQSTSKDPGKLLAELNLEKLRTEQKLNEDHSLVKSEAEILVEIEAKILEVDEDAFPDAYKDLEGSTNIIPDSQASILLNALTREEATDLLSTHHITVKNGEKAEIKVVQEFVFPSFPTGKPSTQATGEGDGRQVRGIGFELSVTPTVQKNYQNQFIDLQLSRKITELDGFVEYGGPSDPTGGIGFSKRLPSGILIPVFSVRKIAPQYTVLDGTTVIIGELSRKEEKNYNYKIPVSTESNQTRSLLMFVSAKIASTESSPERENIQNNTSQSTFKDPGKLLAELNLEKLRTEQKLNEQLDKANKKLDEILAIYNQQIIAINNQLNGESPKSSKVEMIRIEQNLNVQLAKANKKLAEVIALMNQLNGESPKSSKVEIIGIGAKLIDVNGSCTIAELIPGGPAKKSKLLEPKDVILKVSKSDGTLADVSDMKLYEIVELIKGPKNSKVKLLIQPFKNPATLKEVSIKRKPFHIYHQTHENKVSEKVAPVPIVDANLMGFPKEIRVGETGVEWIFNAKLMGIPKKIKVGEKIFVPQEKPMTK